MPIARFSEKSCKSFFVNSLLETKNVGKIMQDFPLVSVVILNYNGLKYLAEGLIECLDSVIETNYPNLEIVFVDNGSTDRSAYFIRKNYKSKIKIVENKRNLGFAEGFNTGIRVSRGKYIALLSNDMTVDPNWLNPIVKLMESEPKIGLAGFKRLLYGTKNIIDGIGGNLYLCGRVKPVGTLEIDRGQYDIIKEDLDYIGGAMVIRKKTLKEVGLFDPDYIIFSEDLDLCYRIRKRGYKTVYVPNAVIWHRGQATLEGMDPVGSYTTYMSERSRIRFALIHFVPIRIFSTLIIDLAWLILTNPAWKKALLKAYYWNIKNIGITLKRRAQYGPSPPHGCKFPLIPFKLSSLKRRLRKIVVHNQPQKV